MTALKDLYSTEFYQRFAQSIRKVIPSFDETLFQQQIFAEGWVDLELKDRMYRTSQVLHLHLPQPFPKAAATIVAIIEQLKKDGMNQQALEFMCLPDYIERYGLEHYEESMNALRDLTAFTSAEFAIRPFIVKYPQTIDLMLEWADHSNEHVRRLASEGSRPRLPWAMALPELKRDPQPVLPILEKLQRDPSEYVRRSVANNLNDISKDHPDLVLAIAKRWLGQSKETDKLVKHACRTLLKAGNAEAMQLFGYCAPEEVQVTDFQLDKPVIDLGERIECRFQLENISNREVIIRLEYGVYFLLKNGEQSRKVFKISEKKYATKSINQVSKSIHFKPISTRTFYAGEQQISIIVNGVEMGKEAFELRL